MDRPRDARAASNNQCAESDLSVRPISTCFTSLVTRGSREAGVRAPLPRRALRPRSSPSSPAAASRLSTASSSSSILAFGGSAHSGSGIRSIFRRFSRSETISARKPCAASLLDRRPRGSCERLVLLCGRDPAMDGHRAVATDRRTPPNRDSGRGRAFRDRTAVLPAGRRRCRRAFRSRSPTWNPLAHSASTSSRTRVASACRSGTAVPSQSNTAASNRRPSAAPGPSRFTADARGPSPSSGPRRARRAWPSGRPRARSRTRPRFRRCGAGSTSAGARRSPFAATSG